MSPAWGRVNLTVSHSDKTVNWKAVEYDSGCQISRWTLTNRNKHSRVIRMTKDPIGRNLGIFHLKNRRFKAPIASLKYVLEPFWRGIWVPCSSGTRISGAHSCFWLTAFWPYGLLSLPLFFSLFHLTVNETFCIYKKDLLLFTWLWFHGLIIC